MHQSQSALTQLFNVLTSVADRISPGPLPPVVVNSRFSGRSRYSHRKTPGRKLNTTLFWDIKGITYLNQGQCSFRTHLLNICSIPLLTTCFLQSPRPV